MLVFILASEVLILPSAAHTSNQRKEEDPRLYISSDIGNQLPKTLTVFDPASCIFSAVPIPISAPCVFPHWIVLVPAGACTPMLPPKCAPPFTSSLLAGVVIPIPTLLFASSTVTAAASP